MSHMGLTDVEKVEPFRVIIVSFESNDVNQNQSPTNRINQNQAILILKIFVNAPKLKHCDTIVTPLS